MKTDEITLACERISHRIKPLTYRQNDFIIKQHYEGYKKHKYNKWYFSKFQVSGDWQIERLFCSYRRRAHQYEILEVQRSYLNTRTLTFRNESLKRNTMHYIDAWSYDSDMKFGRSYVNITGYELPNNRYHSKVIKYGYDKKLYMWN